MILFLLDNGLSNYLFAVAGVLGDFIIRLRGRKDGLRGKRLVIFEVILALQATFSESIFSSLTCVNFITVSQCLRCSIFMLHWHLIFSSFCSSLINSFYFSQVLFDLEAIIQAIVGFFLSCRRVVYELCLSAASSVFHRPIWLFVDDFCCSVPLLL